MGPQSPNTSKKQSKAEKTAKVTATRERVALQREKDRRAAKRRSAIIFGASGVAVIALIAGLTAVVMSSDDEKKASATNVIAEVTADPTTTSPIAGVVAYKGSQDHISMPTEITYQQVPPLAGQHDPVWQNCGIYTSAIPNRNAVHALEHGAVWITYAPTLPADQVALLTSKVKGKTYTLLSPYEGMETPITATAWGLQLRLDKADDPRLDEFIKEYREGPQTLEPGAMCTGGVGKPTS